MKAIALAAAVGALAVGLAAPSSAEARTCLQKTVTAPGKHVLMRTCFTPRHHAARRMVTKTTRVVTTDDFVTTRPVRTRTRFYSTRMPREEIVGYGSTYMPTTQYSATYQPSYAMRCGPGDSRNWGYNNFYGSSSPPWCQASASSHPAFTGGSGQFTQHPMLGWGY